MKALTIISLLFLLLMGGQSNAQSTEGKNYVKIEVDGLSCPFCAYGLERKLKQIDGANDVIIDLEAGEATLTVLNKQEFSEESLQKAVKDAGFTPKKITFSQRPFKKEKNE